MKGRFLPLRLILVTVHSSKPIYVCATLSCQLRDRIHFTRSSWTVPIYVMQQNEPEREKTDFLTGSSNVDLDQPTHPRSLIRVFVVRMKNCILGYPKCTQWRFLTDSANAQTDLSIRWAHMSEGKFSNVTSDITKTRLFKYIENFTSKNW